MKNYQKPLLQLSSKLLHHKTLFDDLVIQYKTLDYIPEDPISHPYLFLCDEKECELVAFVTALFSYGRRDIIIPTISGLLKTMDNRPWDFLQSFDAKKDAKLFKSFIYRFNKPADVIFLLKRLQWAYREFESLENLFIESANRKPCKAQSKAYESELQTQIAAFLDTLTGIPGGETLPSYGLKFLFAHPVNGGPCKRMNMFLRWVVRQDLPHEPKVDLGLWKKALTPADLMIPLDTHVGKMNRHFGFTKRQDNSWKTAEEIMSVFRRFCPEDPVRYDYALMGYSISGLWREAAQK